MQRSRFLPFNRSFLPKFSQQNMELAIPTKIGDLNSRNLSNATLYDSNLDKNIIASV